MGSSVCRLRSRTPPIPPAEGGGLALQVSAPLRTHLAVSAAKKHYGEEADIVVKIDREDGSITATCDGRELDSEETVGRIGAQTAKQVMIQKIREAERDALYDEYHELTG